MIKRNFITAMTSILIIATIAIIFVLQANVLSISLIGLSYSYEDLILHYLDEPTGARALDMGPFCGGPEIERQLRNRLEKMVCLKIENYGYKPGQCNPVASGESIPNYVAPFFDLLEVRLAITSGNIVELSKYIENYGNESVANIGDLSGAGYIGNVVVTHNKIVSMKQCDSYGFISIHQNYFSD